MVEVHLDPLGGIAGDMFVAAVLDFRPDLAAGLFEALAHCPLITGVEFELNQHNDGILTGKRFRVRRDGRQAEEHPSARHDHHDHDHAGHHHHHHDDHQHSHHDHADWRVIRDALENSSLDRDTVNHAIAIFTELAGAEARVHGVEPEAVRFHEVGAWDSIADIVAAAWLITHLGVTRWTVGVVPLGSGRVRTAHGLLPVPAPATTLLLEGFPTIDDGIAGERVTPTGAAILRYLCNPFETVRVPRRLAASAHGFGTRQMQGLSNCLRLIAFEQIHLDPSQDQVAVIECEIDDQTGEDMAQAIEHLRTHKGVFDVVQMPVFGKKGRMMTHLRILADPVERDAIVAAVFEETTTIGVRHSVTSRTILPRQADTVEIEGRSLRLKLVDRPLGRTAKIEAEDLSDVAGSASRTRLRRLAEQGPWEKK